ncbi:MAG: heat-inducible transcriptional repressor HrcA [Endomicrobiia bacterium]
MRFLSPEVYQKRKIKTLQTIVYHYINTAKPVSSKAITENYSLSLSSATIRKIMAELEKEGYLYHPHTSAGRVPTDKCYRWFVDSLVEMQKLTLEEKRKILDEFRTKVRELDDILIKTSHLLTVVSNYAGFTVTPKLERNRVKNLDIIKVSDDKILIFVVTDTGLVRHRIIKVPFTVDESYLREITEILNTKFTGILLSELKYTLDEIVYEIKNNQKQTEALLNMISKQIFEMDEEKIYIEGTSNIASLISTPEFNNLSKFWKIIEQKKLLAQILEKDLDKLKGVEVKIGKEHELPELKDISLIRSVYKVKDKPLGVLGIIGPKRMEYSKMISLVDFVTSVVNKLLERIAE